MSTEPSTGAPDDASPRTAFVRALGVPRNARIGAAVGVAFALGVYLLFGVAPGGTGQSLALLAVLAFVIAVSTAILVTTLLTVRNAARMTADLPKWIRRGGTAGLVGGGLWLVTALPTVTDPLNHALGPVLLPVASYLYPLPALGVLCGAWALHARNRHTGGYPAVPRVANLVPGIEPGDVAGLVGSVVAGVAATGLVLLAWIGLVEPGSLLRMPTTLHPRLFVGAYLLAATGNSLLGAAAIRARGRPGPAGLSLLASLPALLAGLTVLATLPGDGLLQAVCAVAVGGPWVLVGRSVAAGDGVPPVEQFRPDHLPQEAPDPE